MVIRDSFGDLEEINTVSFTVIERALNEIKEFITILFGSCIRFYNTLVLH
jgi:hypothetical protein